MCLKKYFCNSLYLNICTTCNLKCDWCYKQSSKSYMLSFVNFEKFYERIIRQNIEKITLIGGEPTMHPDFLSIIEQLNEKQIFLNTNGLMFSEPKFLFDCINLRDNVRYYYGYKSGLQAIAISLKGYDRISFLNTTKVDGFERLCYAITNLNDCDISTTYTYTYAENMNIDQIDSFISFLNKYKINTIVLNDVRPYYQGNNMVKHPKLINGLDKLMYSLESSGITAYLRMNHPLCNYNPELLDYVIKNQRLISRCAVKSSNGYFFSPSLELIPCNELFPVVLGKFETDFNSFAELEQLWDTQYIRCFYQKLSGYPEIKCQQCSLWKICGGSCILHWVKEKE